MKSDSEFKPDGLRVRVEGLDAVEAERFASLILREPFDYTDWQQALWPKLTVDEIDKAARDCRFRQHVEDPK